MSGLVGSGSPGVSDVPHPQVLVNKIEPKEDEIPLTVKIEIEDTGEPNIKEEIDTEETCEDISYKNLQKNQSYDYFTSSQSITNVSQHDVKLEFEEEQSKLTLQEDNIKEETVIGLTEVSSLKPPSELFDTPELFTEQTFTCNNCNKTFPCKRTLRYHIRSHLSVPSKTKYEKKLNSGKFQCEICDNVYGTKGHLNRHKLTHLKGRPFMCDTCKKTFPCKRTLQYHIRSHLSAPSRSKYDKRINKRRLFICDTCKKAFKKRDHLIQHLPVHTGERPHACDSCEKKFLRKYHLKIHKFTHTGEKPFKCNQCYKIFSSRCSMTWHIKYHCSFANVECEKPFACKKCNKKFVNKAYLNSHMKSHLEHVEPKKVYSCNVCSETYLRSTHLRRHQLTHMKEKPFICDLCKKGFNQKPHLASHLRVHTGEKPHVCDICNIGFSHKSTMTRHKLKHTAAPKATVSILSMSSMAMEPMVACRICKELFMNRNEMLAHKETDHKLAKPFKCDMCSKSFELSSYLSRHKQIHGAIRKFTCDHCNKSFTNRHVLVSHLQVHTEEKPFECNICFKRFTRKSTLTTHRRTHTGDSEKLTRSREKQFQCDLCEKKFRRKSCLSNHKKVHKAEVEGNLLPCDECDRTFPHEKALKHHIDYTHRPGRYICEYCDKPFYYKSDHDKHKKIHTGKNPHACAVCNVKFPNMTVLNNHECIMAIYLDEMTE